MPAGHHATAEIASRYARAVFAAASEKNAIKPVQEGINALADAVKNHADFRRVLTAPTVANRRKGDLMQALVTQYKMHNLVEGLCRVLAHHGRLGLLEPIAETFNALVLEASGVVRAEVTTASPLSDAQRKEVAAMIAASVGGEVEMVEQTDDEILGGMVVRIGSRMLDMSVKTQLQTMKQRMLSASMADAA